MSIPRYFTIGAVASDARSLAGLGDRLAGDDASLAVLCRRSDEDMVRLMLPGATVRRVETGLSRRQWLEFASVFFSASTVSFLMGVVHLWTGLIVQAVLTVASVGGILVYRRLPRLEKILLGFGLPEKLVDEWAAAFPASFALVLATVPEEGFDAAQEAFLEDDALLARLAVDRRPVF